MQYHPSAPAYPPAAPSLLGQPYMAAKGQELVIGATQHSGLTPHEALAMCSAEERIAYCSKACRSEANPAQGQTVQTSPSAADILGSSQTDVTHHSERLQDQGLHVRGTEGGAGVVSGARNLSGVDKQVTGSRESTAGGPTQDMSSAGGGACASMEAPVAAATQDLLRGAVELWPALRGWRLREVR